MKTNKINYWLLSELQCKDIARQKGIKLTFNESKTSVINKLNKLS